MHMHVYGYIFTDTSPEKSHTLSSSLLTRKMTLINKRSHVKLAVVTPRSMCVGNASFMEMVVQPSHVKSPLDSILATTERACWLLIAKDTKLILHIGAH